jgi:hypothetical protein
MKARTGMLLGSLLLLSAMAQANERAATKPADIKFGSELNLVDARPLAQQVIRAAAANSHLACENSAGAEPAADGVRAPAGKSRKSAPAAPKRSRGLGCDSFHCVARNTVHAGERSGPRPGA